ncbi:hypothetical protein [Lutibacter sp.]|uniref:hypothetical protein n=1 Tax=Lutibacter sp. TaxID=1925666 RepID=UPI003561B49C
MKKTRLYLMVMMLSLGAFTTVNASEKTPRTTPTEIPAEIQVMLNRLEEIKGIDKKDLNRAEKKELRKEVRAINSEIRSSGNGIYISVGAIIIILLLIILL